VIDPLSEHLVSLPQAAKLLPARRGGRPVHVSCLYRWTVSGCKGIQLESLQLGGTRVTSREALARFFSRLSSPLPQPQVFAPKREQEIAAAERRLK